MRSIPLSGETIGTWVVKTGGRTSGFDYLRILLAAAVILSHSKASTLGIDRLLPLTASGLVPRAPSPPLFQPILWAVLPSFFALSGFLVAGSLERCKTVVEFVLLRALRIVPALFVETVLAAFVLGPLVTELPLGAYFTDPMFLSYPLNIVGDIHFSLPGVFSHNPYPNVVNQQLWTIPAELLCYLSLVILWVLGLIRLRSAIPALTILAVAGFSLAPLLVAQGPSRWSEGLTNVGEHALLVSFLCGVTMFVWRDKLPLNPWLFGISVVLSYALLYDGAYLYLATVPVAYATTYAGLTDLPKSFVTRLSDFSYGVYLYGFPIQQLIAYLFPQNKSFVVNFLGALLVSLVLAALSWTFIEEKVLNHRKMVVRTVSAVLDRASYSLRSRFGLF